MTSQKKGLIAISILLTVAACSTETVTPGTDAGMDTDSSMTTDGGVDMATNVDLGVDAGDPCAVTSLLVTTSDFSTGFVGRISTATHELIGTPVADTDQDSVPLRSGCTTFLLEHSRGNVRVQSAADPTMSTHSINLNPTSESPIYTVNPLAVVSISETKGYVTMGATNNVAIINPTLDGLDGHTGDIDLSVFLQKGDIDGHVDMSAMVLVGTNAYVALGNYYFGKGGQEFAGVGVVAVIDTTTDTLVDQDSENGGMQGITLHFQNPVDLVVSGTRIFVACPGIDGVEDGGIEFIDTTTGIDLSVVSEATLGGTLSTTPGGIAAVDEDRFFAITGWSYGVGGVPRLIEAAGGTVGATLAVTDAMSLRTSGNTLYVAAGATQTALRAFSATTLTEVTPATGPVVVGTQSIYGVAEAP